MRRRTPSPSELEYEYLHAPEPTWRRFFRRSSARVCLRADCGHVTGPGENSCPKCGEWELADLFRTRPGRAA